ncbi:MAG: hypothetical protein A2X86_09910 [Bdellovibrionales bacterium GWA2_49_15]|nr:MAG: hypothetical protein A2X86_09910 [Bdellovibrionales bacterium GWA2_49_15]HAZ13098.1 hypothetical protein [Bdellovibrionales bacterium]
MNSGLDTQPISGPYPILRELGSLQRMIGEHQAKILGHKKRVEMIQATRQEKSAELAEKKALQKTKLLEIRRHENALAQSEENLGRAKGHSNEADATRQVESIEKEMLFLGQQISQLEEQTFKLIGESDILLVEIKEIEQYLTGSEKALKEVGHEVDSLIEADQLEIKNLEERFTEKLSELNAEFKNAFLHVVKKFGKGKPLAWFEEQRCDCCRFLIDRQTGIELSHGIHPHFCPGCGRLLVVR